MIKFQCRISHLKTRSPVEQRLKYLFYYTYLGREGLLTLHTASILLYQGECSSSFDRDYILMYAISKRLYSKIPLVFIPWSLL